MLFSDFVDEIEDRLAYEIEIAQSWLSCGEASDYADYMKYCGEISGFKKAIAFIRDIENELIEEDD